MTFKKILVAIDRSFQASCVFARALSQAKPKTSSLMIVHTIRLETNLQPPHSLDLRNQADVTDMYTTLRRLQQKRIEQEIQKARNWLQFYYDQAIAQGVSVEIDCRVGEPETWICDLAFNQKADLIVLGRRGYKGLKESALGSVSNYVVHHAPCSVLVVDAIVPTHPTPENSAAPKSYEVVDKFVDG
jgi:nucleotide-binding universal stress UspA family protein